MLESLLDFFADKWITLGSILILFFLGQVLLRFLVHKAIKFADDGDDSIDTAREKQAKTLGDLILRSGNLVIYLIIIMMVLQLFGVNVTPILAGAGVIGVAIGLGAQSVAKDLISGLLIIMEHRYALGDIIKVGDFQGTVVKITMRSTVLRNDEGQTFYIANGSVAKVINYSQSEQVASK